MGDKGLKNKEKMVKKSVKAKQKIAKKQPIDDQPMYKNLLKVK